MGWGVRRRGASYKDRKGWWFWMKGVKLDSVPRRVQFPVPFFHRLRDWLRHRVHLLYGLRDRRDSLDVRVFEAHLGQLKFHSPPGPR